ncbi:MAG TPA: hypothetical protein VFY90_01420 [Tepidiformaceae bacterium]|nr:hypothetical protein [Tepidiformaceae bacterium]
MTRFKVLMAFAGAVATLLPLTAIADSGYASGDYGYDISYPQCGGEFPSGDFEIGIVGVNGGKSFTDNPCFAAEIEWAKAHSTAPAVYINTNATPKRYVGAGCTRRDAACSSYEYGREAAAYAVNYANAHGGADVTRYWLDVETMNTWSRNTSLNAKTLEGFIDGIRAKGKTVAGVYSTSYQWGRITGGWVPQGGLDNWVPVPDIENWPADAEATCRTTTAFAGGSVVMLQWWDQYDENYACPPQV